MRNPQTVQDLWDACTEEGFNISLVEELLRAGATPMTEYVSIYNEKENFYTALLDLYLDSDSSERLVPLTELFLKYGLDVEHPVIDYESEEHDVSSPFWLFAFEYDLKTPLNLMRLLLNKNPSVSSAWDCICHAQDDIWLAGVRPEDESWWDCIFDAARKVMLCASYPEILADADMQKLVCLHQNSYDIKKFRNWEEYEYQIVNVPEEEKTSNDGLWIDIYEKNTNRKVWTFFLV